MSFRANATGPALNQPLSHHSTVTQDNDADLDPWALRLVINAAGDIAVHDVDGNDEIYTIPSSALPYTLDMVVRRVLDTGTDIADADIIAQW